jgi:hypothetical protein
MYRIKIYSLLSIPLLLVTLTFSINTPVFAQSPATNHIVSDYAKDAQEGEKDIANNQQAQKNQRDNKDVENIDTKEVNQEGVNEVDSTENIQSDENQMNENDLNNQENQKGEKKSDNNTSSIR